MDNDLFVISPYCCRSISSITDHSISNVNKKKGIATEVVSINLILTFIGGSIGPKPVPNWSKIGLIFRWEGINKQKILLWISCALIEWTWSEPDWTGGFVEMRVGFYTDESGPLYRREWAFIQKRVGLYTEESGPLYVQIYVVSGAHHRASPLWIIWLLKRHYSMDLSVGIK